MPSPLSTEGPNTPVHGLTATEALSLLRERDAVVPMPYQYNFVLHYITISK